MDREARAVGAGTVIEVNGKTYSVRPLSIRQLQEVQREALRSYKRQIMQTYADSVNFLPNGHELMERKIEEISRWDIGDIPTKMAYDLRKAVESPAVIKWMDEKIGRVPEGKGGKMHALTQALEKKEISKAELETLAGCRIVSMHIPYDNWWVSSSLDGMAVFVWASVGGADRGIPLEEIRDWPVDKLSDVAGLVESITVPDMGNT